MPWWLYHDCFFNIPYDFIVFLGGSTFILLQSSRAEFHLNFDRLFFLEVTWDNSTILIEKARNTIDCTAPLITFVVLIRTLYLYDSDRPGNNDNSFYSSMISLINIARFPYSIQSRKWRLLLTRVGRTQIFKCRQYVNYKKT